MRKAKELDYWEKVYKRNFDQCIMSIDLNGLNNLPEIKLSKGIMAICGLNGAGKSTIVSAIKAIFDMPLSEYDNQRIKSIDINAKYEIDGNIICCSNSDGERLSDKAIDINKILFLDCNESSKTQNFIVGQSNIEELIEQNEPYIFSEEDLEAINYLIGKSYSSCIVIELEDIDENCTIPFFSVQELSVEYDSRGMGSGEHFLLYLFWCIKKCDKGTIFIIEEPETYISISSQIHFSNYLAKQVVEKGIQIIMTTHSPYLLGRVRNENIRIISRVGNMVVIKEPDESMSAENILGISEKFNGTLFVEDKVAYDFLSIILEDKAPYILKNYTIDIATGGENAITQRLKFPKTDKIKYTFIGVYDGDMRERINQISTELQWDSIFLPGNKPLEELCRKYLHDEKHIESFCSCVDKDKNYIVTILSMIAGLDYHDWFEELRKKLNFEGKYLVRIFYDIMEDLKDEIDLFVKELMRLIN